MPSDDLVLNVRQIAGYPDAGTAQPSDSVLLQRGGLGGPYLSLDAQTFVGTACATGGPMSVGFQAPADSASPQLYTDGLGMVLDGQLMWNCYVGGGQEKNIGPGPSARIFFDPVAAMVFQYGAAGGAGAPVNLNTTLTISPTGYLTVGEQVLLARDPTAPLEAASAQWVEAVVAALQASTVNSFNGRIGDIILQFDDIIRAGAAPIFSPRFTGSPMADTPAPWSHSSRLATTAFVHRNSVEYIQNLLNCHSFVFKFNGRSGEVVLTADDIATALAGATLPFAPLDSPNFSGVPSAPTAAVGSVTSQIATTAFVMHAVAGGVAGVASFNGRTGLVTLTAADVTSAGAATLASPAFTGTPTAPTVAQGDASTHLATTAFVMAAVAESTAGVVSFNGREGAITLTSGDISGASGALVGSPAFTGVPTAPTAAAGVSTTQIATTAYVTTAVAASVVSFDGRTGAVVLVANDISAAGGAALASPAFTGVPTAPTAAPATSNTQLATTAFVMAALAAEGVTTFNGRIGAVTLTTADVTAAGGAVLASPAFIGTPTAPTASLGTSTTQLATTAFVLNELGGSGAGVVSFNGRNGAVSLGSADLSSAGGALLAGPAFTGIPTAPTAAAATSTTQLATTAFVMAAIAAPSTTTPSMDGTAAVGAGTTWARSDHVHPSDTSRLALTGGILSGALTVNAVTTLGPTNHQSMFDTHGSLLVSTATALPTTAAAGHVVSGAGVFFGSLNAGASLGSNVFGDGTQWRYAAAGTGTAVQAIANAVSFLCFPTGAAGAQVSGATTGSLQFAGNGDLSISGSLSQGSDARGKRDIKAATDGLDQVRQLTPKRYHRVYPPGSDIEDREELGFVAQDVRDVSPVAVHEDDEERLSLELMPLIAMLTNAVKELDARLAALEPKGAMS